MAALLESCQGLHGGIDCCQEPLTWAESSGNTQVGQKLQQDAGQGPPHGNVVLEAMRGRCVGCSETGVWLEAWQQTADELHAKRPQQHLPGRGEEPG